MTSKNFNDKLLDSANQLIFRCCVSLLHWFNICRFRM